MKRGVLFTVLLIAVASAGLFSVEHSRGLAVGEDQGYVLTVSDANTSLPIEGVLAEVFTDELLAEGTTGPDGSVHFFLHPEAEGFIAFRLTADGYNEYVVVEEALFPPTPVAAPEPSVAANTTAPITGFLTLQPNERSMFYFVFALAIACLFGAAYVFYTNFVMGEKSEWGVTQALDAVAQFLKG